MESSPIRCSIVDSFAASPGTGNPAAVVLLPVGIDENEKREWMQKVAAEFNLSETAFCWPTSEREKSLRDERSSSSEKEEEIHWNIRYFTPTVEIALCGHATLASAAVLYQTLTPKVPTAIVFHASEDTLTMQLAASPSSRRSKVSMSFPPKPPIELLEEEGKIEVKKMLQSAFSIDLEPLYIGLSDLGDLLIELESSAFNKIGYNSLNYKAFCEYNGYARGVIICCVAPQQQTSSPSNQDNNNTTKSIDFLSRFFGPKAGINEDPVTGSAHCALGPYFSKKFKKEKVVGCQMSVRRGIVECDVGSESVTLTGTGITTMTGELFM